MKQIFNYFTNFKLSKTDTYFGINELDSILPVERFTKFYSRLQKAFRVSPALIDHPTKFDLYVSNKLVLRWLFNTSVHLDPKISDLAELSVRSLPSFEELSSFSSHEENWYTRHGSNYVYLRNKMSIQAISNFSTIGLFSRFFSNHSSAMRLNISRDNQFAVLRRQFSGDNQLARYETHNIFLNNSLTGVALQAYVPFLCQNLNFSKFADFDKFSLANLVLAPISHSLPLSCSVPVKVFGGNQSQLNFANLRGDGVYLKVLDCSSPFNRKFLFKRASWPVGGVNYKKFSSFDNNGAQLSTRLLVKMGSKFVGKQYRIVSSSMNFLRLLPKPTLVDLMVDQKIATLYAFWLCKTLLFNNLTPLHSKLLENKTFKTLLNAGNGADLGQKLSYKTHFIFDNFVVYLSKRSFTLTDLLGVGCTFGIAYNFLHFTLFNFFPLSSFWRIVGPLKYKQYLFDKFIYLNFPDCFFWVSRWVTWFKTFLPRQFSFSFFHHKNHVLNRIFTNGISYVKKILPLALNYYNFIINENITNFSSKLNLVKVSRLWTRSTYFFVNFFINEVLLGLTKLTLPRLALREMLLGYTVKDFNYNNISKNALSYNVALLSRLSHNTAVTSLFINSTESTLIKNGSELSKSIMLETLVTKKRIMSTAPGIKNLLNTAENNLGYFSNCGVTSSHSNFFFFFNFSVFMGVNSYWRGILNTDIVRKIPSKPKNFVNDLYFDNLSVNLLRRHVSQYYNLKRSNRHKVPQLSKYFLLGDYEDLTFFNRFDGYALDKSVLYSSGHLYAQVCKGDFSVYSRIKRIVTNFTLKNLNDFSINVKNFDASARERRRFQYYVLKNLDEFLLLL